ncbi:hypothetical protein Pelo_5550 [Pelomyxa schiedti]|nr:hypothetical protein Pelo_5550 [Pelomyxa schiedti]
MLSRIAASQSGSAASRVKAVPMKSTAVHRTPTATSVHRATSPPSSHHTSATSASSAHTTSSSAHASASSSPYALLLQRHLEVTTPGLAESAEHHGSDANIESVFMLSDACLGMSITDPALHAAFTIMSDAQDASPAGTCVVIPGDMVEFALNDSKWPVAEKILNIFMSTGITVVITVGTHPDPANPVVSQRLDHLFAKISAQERVASSSAETHDIIFNLGSDIFVCMCSQHGPDQSPRIKQDQLTWCLEALKTPHLKHKRLHLVTHHSIWEDEYTQGNLSQRERLETTLIAPLHFFSAIHGCSTRFSYEETRTPRADFEIIRISVKTKGVWDKTFCGWDLHHEEPTMLVVGDE